MQEFKKQTYQNLVEEFGEVRKENLFIFLGKVQDAFGYVPREAVSDLAARTGLSDTQIYGALTSYKGFKTGREVNN
jgi:NADH:ubiquinone oxidoreductase subunit E